MSDEYIKKNEPAPQAVDSKELSETDLEGVTGGDKKPEESISFNFTKPAVTYTQEKAE